MAQHDYIISNQGFPATRADINNVLNSIATLNSGTSAPSTQYAGQMWIDTTTATNWILYIYDGADNIQIATINTSTNTVNFTDSALDVLTDTTPQLGGNLDVNGNSIVSTSNANITLAPDGTGDVVLSADTVKIGDSNANATITTDGTGDLILNTNSGSSSGSITIKDGANGDIEILPNGTGVVKIDGLSYPTADGTSNQALVTNGSGVLSFATVGGSFADGTAGSPSITFASDTNTGIFRPTADTIAFTEGGTEAMRIDSSGRVGIGTTSPSVKFQTTLASSSVEATGSGVTALFENSGTCDVVIGAGTSSKSRIAFADSGDWIVGRIDYDHSDNSMRFGANGTAERMRIASDGYVIIGRTTTSSSTAGVHFSSDGQIVGVRGSDYIAYFNRQNNDGNLVLLAQADATEGTISVSGNTVSYNGFTGSHWSRFIDESKPDVLRGTVMESLDQMVDWYAVEFETSYTEKDADGNDIVKTHTEHKPYALKPNEQEGDVITYAWNTEKKDEDDNNIIEQVQATIVKEKDVKHMMSKISDTSEAKNVYGVFSHWDNDDLINNDFYVASVGSYVVRIKAGQVVSKGDLLQSNGDGTAKVQADDLVRASSFAKVLSNTVIETYEDGSFIVPCSLMC